VVRIHTNQIGRKLQREVVLNGGPILVGELTKNAKNATLAPGEDINVQEHAVLSVDKLIEENCELKIEEE